MPNFKLALDLETAAFCFSYFLYKCLLIGMEKTSVIIDGLFANLLLPFQ